MNQFGYASHRFQTQRDLSHQGIWLRGSLIPLLHAFGDINNRLLTPDMNCGSQHLFVQILQAATFHIGNCRKLGLFARRRYSIPEAMEKPRTTLLAEKALHIAPLQGKTCVAADQTRDRLRELEVRKCCGDAERGRALVLAFCAVAYPKFQRFICRCCELNLATLAASFHSHGGLRMNVVIPG